MTFGNRPGIPDGSFRSEHADFAQQVVAGLSDFILRPGEMVDISGINSARMLLLAGDHGGMNVSSHYTVVQGCNGTSFTRLVTCDVDCEFINCDFAWKRGAGTDDGLVSIGASATVRFTNCRFWKSAFVSPVCVALANGGKAHFVNCHFGPTVGVAGVVINNAGLAANVGVQGVNKTGQPLGTVTSIFVTT